MAYKPSLADIPSAGGYRPSIDDIPTGQPAFNMGGNTPNEKLEWLKNLPGNTAAGLAQAGHSMINAPYNLAKFAESAGTPGGFSLAKRMGVTAEDVPHQRNYNFGALLGIPKTPGNELTQGLVSAVPNMLLPNAKLGLVGKVLSKVPGIGGYATGLLERGLPQVAYNAATSENPAEGAKQAAGMQAVMELLPTGFRALKGTAEVLNPKAFANRELQTIATKAAMSEKAMQDAYNVPTQRYAGHWVSVDPEKYLGSSGIERGRLYPDAKRIYDDFMNEPNFNNLHRLQSQIGKDWARISTNPDKTDVAQEFYNYRKSLIGKTKSFLSRDPEALAKYEEGARIGREQYYPFLSHEKLAQIVEGTKTSTTPGELSSLLTKVTEGRKKPIPQNHYLREALKNTERKLAIGQAAQYGIPTVAGTIGGGIMMPGIGHLGGLGAGGLAAHYGTPAFTGLVQNPLIENAMQNYLAPLYYGAGKEAIGYNMNQR